ncbi:hypothetical protein H4582DRAFT_2129753 [Lactarius indigo]|nr:hypothetical protein H4582DRAFT_2129753 [Lactarius indigo]
MARVLSGRNTCTIIAATGLRGSTTSLHSTVSADYPSRPQQAAHVTECRQKIRHDHRDAHSTPAFPPLYLVSSSPRFSSFSRPSQVFPSTTSLPARVRHRHDVIEGASPAKCIRRGRGINYPIEIPEFWASCASRLHLNFPPPYNTHEMKHRLHVAHPASQHSHGHRLLPKFPSSRSHSHLDPPYDPRRRFVPPVGAESIGPNKAAGSVNTAARWVPSQARTQGALNAGLSGIGMIKEAALQAESPASDGNRNGDVDEDGGRDIV